LGTWTGLRTPSRCDHSRFSTFHAVEFSKTGAAGA
jgi:hypothetical protein